MKNTNDLRERILWRESLKNQKGSRASDQQYRRKISFCNQAAALEVVEVRGEESR